MGYAALRPRPGGPRGHKTTALLPQTGSDPVPDPGWQEPRMCSYELGGTDGHERCREPKGCSAVGWVGGGGGCHTDTPSSTHRCSQMLLRLCDPRRGQHLLPQPGGNSPAAPAAGPPETSKPPPDLQAGVGALPSPCIPPQRGSRAPGKDNPELSGRWVLSWGLLLPPRRSLPSPRWLRHPPRGFFSGSPALI